MTAPGRRAVILFLLVLTVVVCVRLMRSAHGGTPDRPAAIVAPAARAAAPGFAPGPASGAVAAPRIRLEGPAGPVAAPSTLHATLAVQGLRPATAGLELEYEARLEDRVVAVGRRAIAAPRGGVTRMVVSAAVPAIDRPAGLDLRVRVRDAGRNLAEHFIPLVAYPAGPASILRDRLARARVALYDPEHRAAPWLRLLGLPAEEIPTFAALALYEGDLIVVGPGGFARGREDLGPILAARARAGMRVLLLEQPTLPATLIAGLRLWPSWTAASGEAAPFAADHPVLRGMTARERAGYFAPAGSPVRPLLPPTRGNFRVIAGERVGAGAAGQEGIRLLEIGIGAGSLLAVQTPLCADYPVDPRARVVLANALGYLLEARPGPVRARLYGRSVEDLPPCLGRLAPRLDPVEGRLRDADLLLVPGDWQAPRLAAAAGLPPVAEVGGFLRDGGTVVILNPQPLVRGYLERIAGTAVLFDTLGGGATAALPPVLDGLVPEDLEILGDRERPQLRLRASPGPDGIEPLGSIPGLSVWRVARGTLIVLSLPDSCDAARTRSLLARLLTNLGVPLDQPPGAAAAAAFLD